MPTSGRAQPTFRQSAGILEKPDAQKIDGSADADFLDEAADLCARDRLTANCGLASR